MFYVVYLYRKIKSQATVLLMLLFCILSGTAQAQHTTNAFYDSDSFWTSIKREPETAPALHWVDIDTLVAVVSNRIFDTTRTHFAGELSTEHGDLKYLVAYILDGQWHLRSFSSLDALLGVLPVNRSLVVYTEGYGKLFTSGVFRAFCMQQQYDVNVLYLDYPSFNKKKKRLGNWRYVNGEAKDAGADFLPILDRLRIFQKDTKRFSSINLFYHSMGNLALMKMMQQPLSTAFKKEIWVDNLILNAPCVPAKRAYKWLNTVAFAKQIIVHYNPEDRVLQGARLVSGNRKLGMGIKNHHIENVTFINFNSLVHEQHSYFLNLPHRFVLPDAIKHYMYHVLHGRQPDWNNVEYFRKNQGKFGGLELH